MHRFFGGKRAFESVVEVAAPMSWPGGRAASLWSAQPAQADARQDDEENEPRDGRIGGRDEDATAMTMEDGEDGGGGGGGGGYEGQGGGSEREWEGARDGEGEEEEEEEEEGDVFAAFEEALEEKARRLNFSRQNVKSFLHVRAAALPFLPPLLDLLSVPHLPSCPLPSCSTSSHCPTSLALFHPLHLALFHPPPCPRPPSSPCFYPTH